MTELISYKYAIPYLIFLAWLVLLLFWEFKLLNQNKNIKQVRFLTIISFLVFFGLRGHLYTDFISYYPYFQNLPTLWNGGFADLFKTLFFEPGFEIYSFLIKSICPNYFFWIFINTLIDVFILNLFFKRHSRYYVLSFILFFLFQGLIIEFNLYRNVKALLLFLISIKYLEEKKMLRYMLLNILGVVFHYSSLLYLPLYFILRKQFSKKLLWSIFIVGNIIVLFGIEYVEPIFIWVSELIGGTVEWKIKLYFNENVKAYGISLGYIERVFTFLLIMLNYNKLIKQSKSNLIFINCYFLYFISFFYFNEISVMVDRIPLLFVCAYWILLPNIYLLIKTNLNKAIFISILLLYGVLKTIKSNDNIFSKYDSLLFGVEKFEDEVDIFKQHFTEINNRR